MVLLAGVFQGRPGQKLAKSLTLAERAFIRYFLSEGHELVNKLGTRIRRHELVSDGQHPLRPAKCPQSAGRPASGGGAGISAGFPALGFASKGEAACESPLLGVVSARASSNVFLTSRQNFLVRSSFIDSLMMLYRVLTWFTARRSSGATLLATLLTSLGSNPFGRLSL